MDENEFDIDWDTEVKLICTSCGKEDDDVRFALKCKFCGERSLKLVPVDFED